MWRRSKNWWGVSPCPRFRQRISPACGHSTPGASATIVRPGEQGRDGAHGPWTGGRAWPPLFPRVWGEHTTRSSGRRHVACRSEEAMNTASLVVLFDVDPSSRQVIREVIGEVADITYLPDVAAAARTEMLRRATVLLAQNTATELTPEELALLREVRLLQFYTAGVDFIPLQAL